MNAKRQLNALNKRNFGEKTTKENIKYLRNKYDLLGYTIPKYLQGENLTKHQLDQAVNKITVGLNSLIKKELNLKNKQSKPHKITFTEIKRAEAQFQNSFKYAPDIEKEVFLNNQTAYFLDKVEVSAPLTFHNFKNKKEFDDIMNTIEKSQREQYKKDYMNNLKHNNRKEANARLGILFNRKKQQFYDVNNLRYDNEEDDRVLNDLFNSLDYVRKREMLTIMDYSEYARIVESLVRQGFSEPLAMDIALKNLGFRPDSYYQFTD